MLEMLPKKLSTQSFTHKVWMITISKRELSILLTNPSELLKKVLRELKNNMQMPLAIFQKPKKHSLTLNTNVD